MSFYNFIFSNIFIIMFLPIWSALLITVNSTIPYFRSKHFTINLTLISTGICAIYSICLLYTTATTGLIINNDIINWLPLNNFSLSFGFLSDNLSALFLVVINILAFFIQLYSYEHLKTEQDFQRYFVYFNIFNFAISGLIISSNLIQSYMFLVLTCVMGYLIYNFWYNKQITSTASKKILLLNIIGDCLILLGIFSFLYFKINYFPDTKEAVLNFSYLYDLSQGIVSYSTNLGFFIICSVFIIGFFTKIVSFPFFSNNTNYIEAPNTSFVCANLAALCIPEIYIMIRLLPVFNISSFAIKLILWSGIILAIICSIMAIKQDNLRKIATYGICSQAGLVIASLGLLSTAEGIFHIINIAFSFTLLILTSDIISSIFNNSDNVKYMGGLRKTHPILAILWGVSALSFTGLFFSGAFSKHQILDMFLNKGLFLEYSLLLITSAIISFVFAKTYFLIFEGDKNYKTEDTKTIRTYFQTKISLSCFLLTVIFLGLFSFNTYNKLFNIGIKNETSLKGILLFFVINILSVVIAFFISRKNKITFSKQTHKTNFSLLSIYKIICQIVYFIENAISKSIVFFIKMFVRLLSLIITKIQDTSIQAQILFSMLGIISALLFALFYYYILKGF